MLNISTSQPVSWPTAAPAPVAPVPAVASVGAAQPSARDPQADSGRGGQGARSGASLPGRTGQEPAAGAPAVQHAPILPGKGRKDGERTSPADYLADAKLRTEQRQEEDQKAREQAEQKRQLQDVLATVWKASAAVVDVVLGREQEPAAVDAAAASGVKDAAAPAPAQGPVANDAQADLPGVEPVPAALRREQEPVAYTEQGASTWPPLETGSLLSRRV